MAAEPTGLDAARRLWQNGRYAEAQEAYEAIAKGPGELAPAVRASIALGRADCLASQGEPDKAIEDLQKAVDEQPEHPGLRARLADLRLARGDWEGASEAAQAGAEGGRRPPGGALGPGPAVRGPGGSRAGRRGLEVVRRSVQRASGGARQGRRCAADRGAGRRAVLPIPGPRGRAERVAQRRHQRDLRGGAAGRPALLAGPLAGGAALPLGLQRGRGDEGVRARLEDQPELGRGHRGRRARPTCRATSSPPGGRRPSGRWRSTRDTPRPRSCWPT